MSESQANWPDPTLISGFPMWPKWYILRADKVNWLNFNRLFHPLSWSKGAGGLCLGLLVLALTGCSDTTRGGQALARGDFSQAVSSYRQALAQTPGDLHVRRQLAQALVHARDYSEAVTVLEGVLAEVPGDPAATLYLGLAKVGTGERDQGFALLTSYRHWQAPREQQIVADAARRLRARTEISPEDLVREMELTLEQARQEELKEQRSTRFGRAQ